MRAWLAVAIYFVVLPSAFADAPGARELLQACSANAPEDAIGLDRLESACPGIQMALSELGFAEQLCESCSGALNASALADLLALHDRYAVEPAAGPNPATVPAVLAKMLAGQTPQPTWWDRFKAWLRQLVGGQSGKVPSWFERLIEHLTVSEWLMQIILYVLIAIVVGMAATVVIVELRAAGLFAKLGIAAQRGPEQRADPATRGTLTLADIEAAAPLERPSMMLRLLLSILVANRELAMERNLTHRELTRRVKFNDAPNRTRFEQLALLAELIRYGRSVADESSTAYAQHVMAGAYALYEQLHRASTRATHTTTHAEQPV